MSRELIRIFYLVTFVAIMWWFLLAVFERFKALVEKRMARFGWAAVAVAVSFVPIAGLPLWQSAYGIWTNPSIPLVAIVSAGLGQRLFGVELLPPEDRRAIWIFGGLAGTVLYLHATVFRGLDLYYLGWDRLGSIAALALAAIFFLWFGKRIGVLFFAALLAFALGTLESGNSWDYVVDPFYWLVSLGVGVKGAVGWWQRQRQPIVVLGAADAFPAETTSVGGD